MSIYRLELQRLQAEDRRIRRAVQRTINRLRTEPGGPMVDCILADLETALVWQVGDDGHDSVLKAVGG